MYPAWLGETKTPGTVVIADQALLRLPPPPTPDALSCVTELIEYTSAVVPGFTSDDGARGVTDPICVSFVAGCATLTLRFWSAWTVTPLIEAESYPVVAATPIVYVSGASERNEKRPVASLVVVDDCEGLTALTRAPAMGLLVEASTTFPLIAPVVPARTLVVPWRTNASTIRAAPMLRFMRNTVKVVPFVKGDAPMFASPRTGVSRYPAKYVPSAKSAGRVPSDANQRRARCVLPAASLAEESRAPVRLHRRRLRGVPCPR